MKFVKVSMYRSKVDSARGMLVLTDEVGFHYIKQLAGSRDFGPYLIEEIILTYDLEEPAAWVLNLNKASEP
ncbi:MAG: hypothetical protein ACRETN_00770 [Nevskiales bacterium]